MSPLDTLPAGITLTYLRQLVGLPDHWDITVVSTESLDPSNAAGLDQVVPNVSARILINERDFYFSPQAMAHTIAHELQELRSHNQWNIFLAAIRHVQDAMERSKLERAMREARDAQIEESLAAMPFWNEYDIPIPRTARIRETPETMAYVHYAGGLAG